MNKNKQLVIIGAGEFAEIAYEYFTTDSEYEVVAFAVEPEYLNKNKLKGLPVLDLNNLVESFPPGKFFVFVAVTYVQLNRARRRLFLFCKEKGYKCASYVSSHAFFWNNVEIGENSFVFENNTVQYNAKIGNNVVLWSGNHIGHGTVIEDDVWITSHDVISGFCRVGKACFIGVNAAVGDNVTIEGDIVLGAGSTVIKNLTVKGGLYYGNPARLIEGKTAYTQFGVKEEEI